VKEAPKGDRTMTADQQTSPSIPRWLRFVLKSDRAGSSWYIGAGFFFAPALAVLSPWQALTTTLLAIIAVAGLLLGVLGIAMATGLAVVLRSGEQIPEDYWRSIIDYPASTR
jgi:VIT1/CCC1 family predicted Fe2+/Mn2+ transporter